MCEADSTPTHTHPQLHPQEMIGNAFLSLSPIFTLRVEGWGETIKHVSRQTKAQRSSGMPFKFCSVVNQGNVTSGKPDVND